jgi:hypothetical protein
MNSFVAWGTNKKRKELFFRLMASGFPWAITISAEFCGFRLVLFDGNSHPSSSFFFVV